MLDNFSFHFRLFTEWPLNEEKWTVFLNIPLDAYVNRKFTVMWFVFYPGHPSEIRNISLIIVGGTFLSVESSEKVKTSFDPFTACPSQYE